MYKLSNYIFVVIILINDSYFSFVNAGQKTTYYIATERPIMLYKHPDYIGPKLKFESTRYGRNNIMHYVTIHANVLVYFGNNFTIDFYFYQFLSNEYRRSFVEMHYKWCDLVTKDEFFGQILRRAKFPTVCPCPPGEYRLDNMTILPEITPKGFPFTKGRIYANISHTIRNLVVLGGYIDMELRRIYTKNKEEKGKK